MRISEQRDPVRTQHAGAVHRILQIIERLARQAVHQIEVDRADARLAQPVDRLDDQLFGLDPADRLLAMLSKGLHAQTGPFHPHGGEHLRPFAAHRARIEFDREDRIVDLELDRQRVDQAQEFDRSDRVGAAPAKGDPAHASAPGQQRGDRLDLAMKRAQVAFEPLALVRLARVATAVEADLLAERDMEVERYVPLRPLQRGAIMAGRQDVEVRRGRIAGVTRHGRFQQFGMIRPHGGAA